MLQKDWKQDWTVWVRWLTWCWTVYSFALILLPKLQAMKSIFKILHSVTLWIKQKMKQQQQQQNEMLVIINILSFKRLMFSRPVIFFQSLCQKLIINFWHSVKYAKIKIMTPFSSFCWSLTLLILSFFSVMINKT